MNVKLQYIFNTFISTCQYYSHQTRWLLINYHNIISLVIVLFAHNGNLFLILEF